MIEITMPALSPTMESGTLSKWLVAVGDTVKSGDVLCEIETDKASMEFESIDEGVVSEILVEAGSEEVPVGTVILRMAGEDEAAPSPKAKASPAPESSPEPSPKPSPESSPEPASEPAPDPKPAPAREKEGRVAASPLARRVAAAKGVDLASVKGSGPGGRIVLADVEGAADEDAPAASASVPAPSAPAPAPAPSPAPAPAPVTALADVPHTVAKLSNVRKVIARRLTEAKQTIPHIYMTVDVQLDALLALRTELNAALSTRKIKLSVNDMVIKALALALREVPACNVSFAGDSLISYERADISVAVAAPSGLITPIIFGADAKPLSVIATEMKALAEKAREGKLQPAEYQGGTASLSNLGMFGIRQFDAVINPPQAMILAVGAGEKRPVVVNDDVRTATVMSMTGSFDHRAVDGAAGAALLQAVKALLEAPLGLVA